MQLQIAGLHMDLSDSLKAHCEERARGLKKYFEQVIDVEVNFSKPTHEHKAEITVQASGIHLSATGIGGDFYGAMDDGISKMERQLTKYKGRMMKHRKRRQESQERLKDIAPMAAVHSVVDESSLEEAPEDMFAEYMPTIVHKDVREVQVLTVDEAVMQMDLLHTNFFIFQNVSTSLLNVVYREPNGTIGWVEPNNSAVKAS